MPKKKAKKAKKNLFSDFFGTTEKGSTVDILKTRKKKMQSRLNKITGKKKKKKRAINK